MLDVSDRPDALANLGGIHQQRNEDAIGPVSLPDSPSPVCECAEKHEAVGVSAPRDFADEPEPELTLFAKNFPECTVLVSDLCGFLSASLHALDLFPALVLPTIQPAEFLVERNALLRD